MLQDQIKERIKQAMRDRNTLERDILRVALGDMQTQEARGTEPLADEAACKIIRKIIKSNGETLDAGPNDTVRQKLEAENTILDTLLPKTLSEQEVTAALEPVADAIKAAGNDGQATGVAMKHLKSTDAVVSGEISGATVAAVVRKIRGQ